MRAEAGLLAPGSTASMRLPKHLTEAIGRLVACCMGRPQSQWRGPRRLFCCRSPGGLHHPKTDRSPASLFHPLAQRERWNGHLNTAQS
jgi:hypothetical protein